MVNAWSKLNQYASTTLAIAKQERMNPVLASSRVIAAYARYGLDLSMVSYAGLVRRPESEYADFMPPSELFPIQFRLSTDDTKQLVKDKLRFHEACMERGIPTPAIYGCITSDPQLDLHGVPGVSTGADLRRAVEGLEGRRLLMKPHKGIFGRGVYRISVTDEGVTHDDGSLESCDAFVERVIEESNPYLIQECMEPHPDLRPILASGALGTFRVVTVISQGEPSIVDACLKIPRGDNVADNFQKGTTGNLLAGVDVAAGTLVHIIGPKPDDPRLPIMLDRHPDTGAKVTDFEIPQWTELCDMVLHAASQLPDLLTCGWDVAITSRGPVVIEANWRYSIYIVQVANQRGVRPALLPPLEAALAGQA